MIARRRWFRYWAPQITQRNSVCFCSKRGVSKSAGRSKSSALLEYSAISACSIRSVRSFVRCRARLRHVSALSRKAVASDDAIPQKYRPQPRQRSTGDLARPLCRRARRLDAAMLLMVEVGGPTMFARIGILRTLERHVGRVFNSDRIIKAAS
jgi:hypothetical protein